MYRFVLVYNSSSFYDATCLSRLCFNCRSKKSGNVAVVQQKNIPLKKFPKNLAATITSNKQSHADAAPGGNNVDASNSMAVDAPTTDAAKDVTTGLGGGSGRDDSVSGFTKEVVP